MFEGAELDCNIAEPLAQVAADMTDSSSTVQVGITFITPRPSRSVERRGLKECRRLCTLSRQGPVGILETVFRDQETPCGATGRPGRTGEPVEGAQVMPPLSQFCQISRGSSSAPLPRSCRGRFHDGTRVFANRIRLAVPCLAASLLKKFCEDAITGRCALKESRQLCRLRCRIVPILQNLLHRRSFRC